MSDNYRAPCKFGSDCFNLRTGLICDGHHKRGQVPCKFWEKCNNRDCEYLHPNVYKDDTFDCKFGKFCRNYECKNKHPNDGERICIYGSDCIHVHTPNGCKKVHKREDVPCTNPHCIGDCEYWHPEIVEEPIQNYVKVSASKTSKIVETPKTVEVQKIVEAPKIVDVQQTVGSQKINKTKKVESAKKPEPVNVSEKKPDSPGEDQKNKPKPNEVAGKIAKGFCQSFLNHNDELVGHFSGSFPWCVKENDEKTSCVCTMSCTIKNGRCHYDILRSLVN